MPGQQPIVDHCSDRMAPRACPGLETVYVIVNWFGRATVQLGAIVITGGPNVGVAVGVSVGLDGVTVEVAAGLEVCVAVGVDVGVLAGIVVREYAFADEPPNPDPNVF